MIKRKRQRKTMTKPKRNTAKDKTFKFPENLSWEEFQYLHYRGIAKLFPLGLVISFIIGFLGFACERGFWQ